MRRIDVEIDASPDQVWAVLADVERWPAWNPSVESVQRLDDGPLAMGSVLRLKRSSGKERDWGVSRVEPGRFLDVGYTVAGLAPVSVCHELGALPSGRSRLTVVVLGRDGLLFRSWRHLAKDGALGLKRQVEGADAESQS
jgi:Polyketide cyclase / dehydrase and lipid transport